MYVSYPSISIEVEPTSYLLFAFEEPRLARIPKVKGHSLLRYETHHSKPQASGPTFLRQLLNVT